MRRLIGSLAVILLVGAMTAFGAQQSRTCCEGRCGCGETATCTKVGHCDSGCDKKACCGKVCAKSCCEGQATGQACGKMCAQHHAGKSGSACCGR